MNDEIQQVKDKIDIVGLIGQYVPLKKSGRNYKGVCPFHSEKTPSFMVSPDLQIFKCFGCGVGGDLFKFMMLKEGMEFREVLEELAGRAGVKLSKSDVTSPQDQRRERIFSANETAAQFYHFLLTSHGAGRAALLYLKQKRGLEDETIKKFRLGYAPGSNDSLAKFLAKKGFSESEIMEAGLSLRSERNNQLFDRFRGRVVFPLTDVRGRVLGFTGRTIADIPNAPKYLNSPETPIFSKSYFLFGLSLARPAIKKAGRVILVEGQMDLVSNVQAGVENIVATSGTALTTEQVAMLAKLTREIVFCFDFDPAGQKALERGVEVCEGQGVASLVGPLPSGAKDPDDAVRQFKKEWLKTLENPVSFYDYYFDLHTRGVSPSDSLGKRRATERLLPLLAKMADPTQKSHFIKKLSQNLDLDEKFVQEAFSQIAKKEALPGSPRVFSLRHLDTISATQRAETLRKYLLCLVLRFNFVLSKKTLAKLSQKDYAGSPLLPLMSVVRQAFLKHGRSFKIKSIRDRVGSPLQSVFDELLLLDLDELESDPQIQEREMEATLRQLKRETLKADVAELLGKIRQAEESKNERQLREYQEKLNIIYQKLKV